MSRAARSSRVEPPAPTVMLSPLIDVVFLLLVFIVLVARFVDREAIAMQLPVSEAGQPEAMGPAVVTLAPDGRVLVGGETVAPARLASVLAGLADDHTAVVVVAEADAELQRAIDAISAAKRAGYRSVAVATQPPR